MCQCPTHRGLPFPPLLPAGPALAPCPSNHQYTSASMCLAKEDHTAQQEYPRCQCFSQWKGPRVAATPCGLQGSMAQQGEQEGRKKGRVSVTLCLKTWPKISLHSGNILITSQSHLDWQVCSSSCYHMTSTVHVCCDFFSPHIFCASFLCCVTSCASLFTLTQGY